MFEMDESKVFENKNNGIKLYAETITSDNINKVFKKYNVPKDIGLLSIDIDGDDWYVWNKLDKKYKPSIVIIEYNFALDNSFPMIYIEQKEKQTRSNVHNNYFNCNLLAMANLGVSKGYSIACVVHCNIIFIRNDLFNNIGIQYLTPLEIVDKYENESIRAMREIKTNLIKNLEWQK